MMFLSSAVGAVHREVEDTCSRTLEVTLHSDHIANEKLTNTRQVGTSGAATQVRYGIAIVSPGRGLRR